MSIQYVSGVERVLVDAINEQNITNIPKIILDYPIANRVQALLDTKVQIGPRLLQNPLYFAVIHAENDSVIDILLRAHVPLYEGILDDSIRHGSLPAIEGLLRAKATPTKYNYYQAFYNNRPQIAKLLLEYKASP